MSYETTTAVADASATRIGTVRTQTSRISQAVTLVAVIVPPGVVHGFSFSRETDGQVFTFAPRAMIEGDVPATGQALRDLFAAPHVLAFEPGSAAMRRITRSVARSAL